MDSDRLAGEREIDVPTLAIVSHQSRADLERCLPGTLDVAARLSTAVVAIDNASTDGSRELLAEQAKDGRLTLIELPSNRGYAAGVNRAFAAAPGEDLLVLNPDVRLEDPAQVRQLAGVLESDPGAGLVAPRLVGSDGLPQPSARRYPTMAAMLGSLPRLAGTRLGDAYERFLDPSAAEERSEVEWVIGAAMLIRRAAFDAVGGFDDGFVLYMEDADFCARLRNAGWSVLYEPGVSVVHGYARASSRTGASIATSRARRRHVRSLARFWRRHPRTLAGIGSR